MKAIIWISLFLLGLSGVLFPVYYLYKASKLPAMDSEFDIEKQLKHSIEGERMSLVSGMYVKPDRSITFNRPDFTRLPKDLVAIYITQMGCPKFFQTPREDGLAWGWRLFLGATVGGVPPGDGGCERLLAFRIAWKLGVRDDTELNVAANKLHAFLQKDQLIAYDLAIIQFERGVVGVDDAAFKLFGKELDKLSLSELAELQLALPPYGYYDDLKTCQNAAIMKQNRDLILKYTGGEELISRDKVNNAIAQPVFCTQRK
ncbi:transglycosylase domain-containing protein [Hyalangium sp.]|uniref:transglycosylase domain-containing protein n=1 Tax=Hyalangium sp. TaxID=2028555 RepID=UPI002D3AEAE7|nr:transglycosylase domain-containing protein [Hyalangium sp.]HYH96295.1 transglycosylase domain-containing protein [Hyalangium sp.]